jgi:hypothetical protein
MCCTGCRTCCWWIGASFRESTTLRLLILINENQRKLDSILEMQIACRSSNSITEYIQVNRHTSQLFVTKQIGLCDHNTHPFPFLLRCSLAQNFCDLLTAIRSKNCSALPLQRHAVRSQFADLIMYTSLNATISLI